MLRNSTLHGGIIARPDKTSYQVFHYLREPYRAVQSPAHHALRTTARTPRPARDAVPARHPGSPRPAARRGPSSSRPQRVQARRRSGAVPALLAPPDHAASTRLRAPHRDRPPEPHTGARDRTQGPYTTIGPRRRAPPQRRARGPPERHRAARLPVSCRYDVVRTSPGVCTPGRTPGRQSRRQSRRLSGRPDVCPVLRLRPSGLSSRWAMRENAPSRRDEMPHS